MDGLGIGKCQVLTLMLLYIEFNTIKTAPISPYLSSAYQKSQWHTDDEIGMSADANRHVPTYIFVYLLLHEAVSGQK